MKVNLRKRLIGFCQSEKKRIDGDIDRDGLRERQKLMFLDNRKISGVSGKAGEVAIGSLSDNHCNLTITLNKKRLKI